MISLLAKWCIPNRERVEDGAVRRAWGALCGFVGIGLNLLLFAGKLVAGSISGSIAITADAFNNLSDAGSSVVTLLGFRLAGKKPDAGHPFGHGRMEYISGLVVAGLILVMGAELAKSSVDKILHPEAVTFSWLACGILLASIAVKLYMYRYNRAVGKKIDSAAMAATAAVGAYLYLRNREDRASRRIYGCFLLAGTGLTLALLLTMGVPAQVLLWGLFAGLCLLLALSARP